MNTTREMQCRMWRDELIELSRGRLYEVGERNRALAHVKVCPDCAIFLEEQRALTGAAAELSSEIPAGPPAALEAVLAARFAAARSPRRTFAVWMGAAAAVVAVAALALFAVKSHAPEPPLGKPSQPIVVATARVDADGVREALPARRAPAARPKRLRTPDRRPAANDAPFVAIPYTVPLDPRERATVVRMEMPVAALMAVGLTVAAPDPEAKAQTDVVVGEDGRIRAIRLLSISEPGFRR